VGEGVLERDAKHDHAAAVVSIEVNPLRDLASSDREEDSSSATIARTLEIV
jgi:hypothetical protein